MSSSLLTLRKGIYSAVSEAYGSEVAALEATANDPNVATTLDKLADWIFEGGCILARRAVALRGRRSASLTAREIVAFADLALIQSPPGLTGTDHCGVAWGAYGVGCAPEGGLGGALDGSASLISHVTTYGSTILTPIVAAAPLDLSTIWGLANAAWGFCGFDATSGNISTPLPYNNFGGQVNLYPTIGDSVYDFSARAVGLVSLTFRVGRPGGTGTAMYWTTIAQIFCYNAAGVQVAASAVTSINDLISAIGDVKTVTVDCGGAVVSRVVLSLQFGFTQPGYGYPAPTASWGIGLSKFFVEDLSGTSGSEDAPSCWLKPCTLDAFERWRRAVTVGTSLKYWSPLSEFHFQLLPAMSDTLTIIADCLHLPIKLTADGSTWGWLPEGAERLLICFGAARLCEVRRDDPRLAALGPIFAAEFFAGLELLRNQTPADVRGLFASLTGQQKADLFNFGQSSNFVGGKK